MVLHVGRFSEERQVARQQQEKGRASLDELGNYRERSITLTAENITAHNYLEYLMELLTPFSVQDIGVCLDTGHCHRIGETLIKVVGIFKECLINVRVQDNRGNGNIDEHLIPYEATTDWARLYGALRGIGYAGMFMYEPMYQPHPERVFAEIFRSYSGMQREYEERKKTTR